MSHPDYANHCNQSCAQETARIHASPWRSRSWLPHRHHLIVRLGAGPIRFVYDSRSKDRKKERKTLEALPRDTLIQVEIGTKGGIQNKGK